jgi:hypothetical protein
LGFSNCKKKKERKYEETERHCPLSHADLNTEPIKNESVATQAHDNINVTTPVSSDSLLSKFRDDSFKTKAIYKKGTQHKWKKPLPALEVCQRVILSTIQ